MVTHSFGRRETRRRGLERVAPDEALRTRRKNNIPVGKGDLMVACSQHIVLEGRLAQIDRPAINSEALLSLTLSRARSASTSAMFVRFKNDSGHSSTCRLTTEGALSTPHPSHCTTSPVHGLSECGDGPSPSTNKLNLVLRKLHGLVSQTWVIPRTRPMELRGAGKRVRAASPERLEPALD